MTDTKPKQETFIIRLWRKSPQDLAWSGHAQHVRTGQQTIIHSLHDLENYFKDYFPPKKEPPACQSGLR